MEPKSYSDLKRVERLIIQLNEVYTPGMTVPEIRKVLQGLTSDTSLVNQVVSMWMSAYEETNS